MVAQEFCERVCVFPNEYRYGNQFFGGTAVGKETVKGSLRYSQKCLKKYVVFFSCYYLFWPRLHRLFCRNNYVQTTCGRVFLGNSSDVMKCMLMWLKVIFQVCFLLSCFSVIQKSTQSEQNLGQGFLC